MQLDGPVTFAEQYLGPFVVVVVGKALLVVCVVDFYERNLALTFVTNACDRSSAVCELLEDAAAEAAATSAPIILSNFGGKIASFSVFSGWGSSCTSKRFGGRRRRERERESFYVM